MENWVDPENFAANCLDAHAFFEEDRICLNGRWRFLSLRSDQPCPEDYFQPTFSSKHWDLIEVPSAWEDSGYAPGFFRGSRPDPVLSYREKKGASINSSANLIGLYRKRFQISEGWSSRQVRLRFCDVRSGLRVWLNGQLVGSARGAAAPVEFDVSSLIQSGYNYICVEVCQCCDASFLEEPGGCRLSGIIGDVDIYALPAQHITDLFAVTTLGDTTSDVMLRVEVRAHNADGLTARVAVMDADQVCYYGEGILSGGQTSILISCKNAQLWSREDPRLYKLAVILWDGIGICHTRQLPFGFRQIRRSGTTLTLNRQPLKIKGVCYRPSAPERMEQELRSILACHFNAVRVFPSLPERFYDLCDQYGLYVLDDCASSHCDPQWDAMRKSRARQQILAHRRHPCVIAWNTGVEDTELRTLDPSRPFCGEDLYCVQSPTIQRLEQMEQGEVLTEAPTGLARVLTSPRVIQPDTYRSLPLLALSYGCSTGNAAPALTGYSEHFRRSKCWCGGFYHQFVDQDRFGSEDPAASAGLLRSDGTPHHLYYAMQKANQWIHCSRADDGSIFIRNLYAFRSLGDLRCSYRITRDGESIEESLLELDILPQQGQSIRIPAPDSMYLPGRYHLTLSVRDPRSGECEAYFQWELANHPHIPAQIPGGIIRDDGSLITLKAEDICYTVERSSGNVTQITVGEQPLLTEPLRPAFYRVKTDAELSRSKRTDEWARLCLKGSLPKPSVVEVDHMAHQITVLQNIGSGMTRRYQLHRDGSLSVEMRLRTGKTAPSRIGMQLALDPGFDRLTWLGLGPWDTYPDRQDCGVIDIHHQTTAEQDEFSRSQEHGNKSQVTALTLRRGSDLELHVEAEEPVCFSAWPYSLAQLHSGDRTPTQTTLTISGFQNGLEQILLLPRTTYAFSFTIRPAKPE